MDRLSREKINKEAQALNNTLDQMYLIHIYRTLHPKAMEFTFFFFFSSTHGTFSRIDHILGHESNLNLKKKKRQAIETVSGLFF